MEISKRKRALDIGIVSLWFHWAMATGAVMLPILLGLWMAKTWIPVVMFLEVALLYYYIQSTATHEPRCYLVVNTCARSIGVSACIMLLTNYLFSSGHILRFYEAESLNFEEPYIAPLVICPVLLIFSLLAYFQGFRSAFCSNCMRRYGSRSERGFIGYVYSREGRMQQILLIWFSGCCTVVTWVYYLLFYINVNYNSSDIFFFAVLPLIIYVGSLIYTGLRYMGLLYYYSREVAGSARQRGAITELRYIVVQGNSIFLAPVDPELPNTRLDTPYSITIRYRKTIPHQEVLDDFCNLAHVDNARVRYLYTSESGNLDGTVNHYIAILDEDLELPLDSHPLGAWYNFYQVKQMVNAHRLAPILRAEIMRVYTIALASKTYDYEGRRLYKVKHYRPTFKLSQIPDMDVDFNDNRWLFIAANNEDRKLFRFRRFTHKLFYGRDI